MRTRTLLLLAVATLLAGLAACGTNEPAATPVPRPTNTSVAVVPADTAPPTEALPAGTPSPAAAATQPPPAEAPTREPTSTEPAATKLPADITEPLEAMDNLPLFEETACPFTLPQGQVDGNTVQCGYLTVAENRGDADSAEIRLAVARFRPEGGVTEPVPVVYLQGGPGGSALELLYLSFPQFESVLESGREIIFFDQRGIGISEPALDCPAFLDLSLDLLDNEIDGVELTLEEAGDAILASLLACEEELSASSDLTAYNSAASAADVDDLRRALGFDQVVLWGTSYGTRLALTVLRDYPNGVQSAILDSVYPPDVDIFLEGPANLDRALNTLFDACAADAACAEAYPELRTVLFETVDRLREAPAPLTLADPLAAETYDALLDGDTLLSLVFRLLYKTEIIPSLPQLIYEAGEGDYNLLALIWGSFLAEAPVSSRGMMFSVQCNEEVPFSDPEAFAVMLAGYPELAGMYEVSVVGNLAYEVCAGWGSGTAGALENEPVASDVPVLILTGEFDPITPPAWGRQAAETLENSFFYEFRSIGHGASVQSCPREMMMAFMADPSVAPDDSCAEELVVAFEVPGGGAVEVEMEEFRSDLLGVAGLAPAGWTEVSPGVFGRGASALDTATLLMQGAAIPADQLLGLLMGQLGLEDAPELAGLREANGLTWTLFQLEAQGLPVSVAIAQADAMSLIVLLQSDADQHEALYESVFLPAVDALVPAD